MESEKGCAWCIAHAHGCLAQMCACCCLACAFMAPMFLLAAVKALALVHWSRMCGAQSALQRVRDKLCNMPSPPHFDLTGHPLRTDAFMAAKEMSLPLPSLGARRAHESRRGNCERWSPNESDPVKFLDSCRLRDTTSGCRVPTPVHTCTSGSKGEVRREHGCARRFAHMRTRLARVCALQRVCQRGNAGEFSTPKPCACGIVAG